MAQKDSQWRKRRKRTPRNDANDDAKGLDANDTKGLDANKVLVCMYACVYSMDVTPTEK